MVFSELYSAYYQAVAKILERAFDPNVTEKDLQKCVEENAFSESVLTILPALKSGRWPLLKEDLSPVLAHVPSTPLTLLEKRWLKAISLDPRIQLFGAEFPDLEGVEPLFTGEDYCIYDRYADGDPFESREYIQYFRTLLTAMGERKPVMLTMRNRFGKEIWVRLIPVGFEYSVKDDKIRILAEGCRFRRFNLGKVTSCRLCRQGLSWKETPRPDAKKELTLLITDQRNALERVMLHFAHFEKQAERVEENRYLLKLKYYESDETELVIRVLSFGPCIQAVAPEGFVKLIKERLQKQKNCGLS